MWREEGNSIQTSSSSPPPTTISAFPKLVLAPDPSAGTCHPFLSISSSLVLARRSGGVKGLGECGGVFAVYLQFQGEGVY